LFATRVEKVKSIENVSQNLRNLLSKKEDKKI